MGTDNQTSQEQVTEVAEKTFTQAELDSIVKDRLKRANEKYADYESLKAKASKYDELEQANKSELEKANEKCASLQAELDGIKKAAELRELRNKVATNNNVPIEILTGQTEEECEAQAKAFNDALASKGVPMTVIDGGEVTRTGQLSGGQLFANWAKDKF